MKQRNLEKVAVCVVVFGLVAGVNATDPPFDLPPVRAVPSDDGGNVLCYGYDCAAVLDELFIDWQMDWSMSDEPIPPEYEVNKSKFCAQLKSDKPEQCNYSSPPSTPDTDPNWQPNGCGTSWEVQQAMSLAISQFIPNQFSGDYDSPYAGVLFAAACNTHDRCYGLGFDKSSCDLDFRDAMVEKCESREADYNVCVGLAGIYHGAVASTNAGQNAYQQADTEHKCAIWAKDMKVNGCPQ